MACRTGCKTKDHASYGECLRDASISWRDGAAHRNWDKPLDRYREARLQGIQPASTNWADTKHALEVSNRTGVAYDAAAGGVLA